MAGFYAIYHGPEGLKEIATRIHHMTTWLGNQLTHLGYTQKNISFFDTLRLGLPAHVSPQKLRTIALSKEINLRYFDNGEVGISLNETTTPADCHQLLSVFGIAAEESVHEVYDIPQQDSIPQELCRTSSYLSHEIFQKYHTETEMMRYIKRLERKDISLAHSMISLGSCTMKLNAAAEMLPLSNASWMNIHPLVPEDQAVGYTELITNLSEQLKIVTGFAGVTLQPNSGAAGEYTGLRIIRSYLESIGQGHRHLILIPASAHGTNPASAIQAGYETLTCACDEHGNVDLEDLRTKAEEHKDQLAACLLYTSDAADD